MFDDRKKSNRLKRELAEIDRKYEPQRRAVKSEDEGHVVQIEYDQETAGIISELEGMKTRKARMKAERFGIELPPNAYGGEQDWDDIPFSEQRFLTAKGLAKVNRQVSKARFVYWKQWIDIVSPIASVIIALLALALSAIALYFQFFGNPATH